MLNSPRTCGSETKTGMKSKSLPVISLLRHASVADVFPEPPTPSNTMSRPVPPSCRTHSAIASYNPVISPSALGGGVGATRPSMYVLRKPSYKNCV